jgi:lipopolysaccharide export system ATP-binding protein
VHVLRTHALIKAYRSRVVVNRVSLEMAEGEIVGLLGPNGAGKTTTFNMIMGLIRPDNGQISLDGKLITSWPMSRRALEGGIGYLSQEPSIFRNLTVEENLMLILENMKYDRDRRMGRCQQLLQSAGILHLAHQKAHSLSGGEKRRLEICRALATNPHFILLDEPFSGVDPIAVADIQGIIVGLRKQGIGILITDHSVRETLEVTDRSYILHQGNILTQGRPEDLVNDPVVKETYLGERFYFRSGEEPAE